MRSGLGWVYDIPVNLQTALLFLVIFVLWSVTRRRRLLPPGPPALPLVGTLPFLGRDMRRPLMKLGNKYGDVFSIYLGSRLVIVLNSYNTIMDAFARNGHLFSGRPCMMYVDVTTQGRGISTSEGTHWREQRRFALQVLKDFGMGKSLLEQKIVEEMEFFITEVIKTNGAPHDFKHLMMTLISNIISSVCYGFRYEYNDPRFQKRLDQLIETFDLIGTSSVMLCFPFLKYLPGDVTGCKKLVDITTVLRRNTVEIVEQHKGSYKTENSVKDFVSAFLDKADASKQDPHTSFTDATLVDTVGDLFGAATESTSATLRWTCLYLIHYPCIQSRIQGEIDKTFGCQDTPSYSQRQKLPYTRACIAEVLRHTGIVPFGLPHTTIDDVIFHGFYIPRGTMVIANLYGLHHDPRYWEKPEEFIPDRFLDDRGNFKQIDEFIPFSIGKRMCLGESLAQMEIFMFICTLLQKFTLFPTDTTSLPSLKSKLGIVSQPQDYCIRAVKRADLKKFSIKDGIIPESRFDEKGKVK